MLISTLTLAEHYDYLAGKFKIAYAFLRRPDLADLPVGTIKLEQGVSASVQEYTTIPESEGKYETHDRYFDVHYMVSGREVFALAPRAEVKKKSHTTRNATLQFTMPQNSQAGSSFLKTS